ncbi:LysR family transcriptional regulator [Phaeobacter inhibens]|uniref:LysR substrate-binding domain-containing protein n=1 Tax=Phaeobacter inhibens TaxID=221822 RepID=UPI00276FD8E7|nr:LysR substrate-binding domain-containing protein [Phaeobacter inhibens]GLO69434.1 LysR family transcriptional regulator [Phaeobacter inhibens]
MKSRLIDIISLDALRVFECAARRMSFSAAAIEFSVTQAAVSRRIKTLEDTLGFALFQRNGRRLSLTLKGERLFLRTQASLDYLGMELDDLAQNNTVTNVAISASAAVSHLWLSQRLRRFNDQYPEVSVRLTITDNLSELSRSDSELAIIYSRGSHPDWTLSPLLSETLVPVASPAYLKAIGIGASPADLRAEDLLGCDLYDYSRSGVHTVTLQDWFDQVAPGMVRLSPRVIFPTYMMAVETALRGEGVILGSRALVHPHLDSGALIELTQSALVTGFGYYLGHPRHAVLGPSEQTLATFLMSERPL